MSNREPVQAVQPRSQVPAGACKREGCRCAPCTCKKLYLLNPTGRAGAGAARSGAGHCVMGEACRMAPADGCG